MTELLNSLPANATVLDLGSRQGSFEVRRRDLRVFDVDQERFLPCAPASFVQADAARLPFPAAFFDLVVANHSLEHFLDLEGVLCEIGRVARPGALLCITVPDASTFTDRVYRWLGRGGGHVNAFTSPQALAAKIESATGLGHAGTNPLFSSFSFLNRRNITGAMPKRMVFFLGGSERFLAALNYLFRLVDRAIGTRLSVYGWCSYFGTPPLPLRLESWSNVCVRCGAGHPEALLAPKVSKRLLFQPLYACPDCGTLNFLTSDGWASRVYA